MSLNFASFSEASRRLSKKIWKVFEFEIWSLEREEKHLHLSFCSLGFKSRQSQYVDSALGFSKFEDTIFVCENN